MACLQVVLRHLSAMCLDGQLLVDLFTNYDCDLDSSNLFERMVSCLVKLAQQQTPPPPPTALLQVCAGTGAGWCASLALSWESCGAGGGSI